MTQRDPPPTVFAHGTTVPDPVARAQEGPHGVGARTRKVDGFAKATGATQYTDDIQLPRMLHARIKRSTRAHARLVKVDTSAALAMPGVVAVLTGKDLPEKYGVIPWTRDEQALCTDKVRYVGDAIAAVAAVDEETAVRAARAIVVEYQDLVAVLDVETAARTGDTPESKVNDAARHGNITKRVELSFGDVTGNLAASDVKLEASFFFQGTTHAAIEPHCALATVEGDVLTVWSATQVPHYLHRELAAVLGMSPARIRVIQPPVGGAFGGKSEPFDLEFVVARLALMTGRPVKCLYTREEVFYAHRGRHPMHMRYALGADNTGHIKAVQAAIDIDGGAYASFGMITAFYAGQLLTGPVGFDSYAFTATRYYTNKPACGPKRGHGSVQPRFALEVLLDMLAQRVGVDPMELRKRNFAGEHVTLVNGQKLGSSGLVECLDAVARASGWGARRGKLPRGRGLGVASSMYISGTNYPVYPNDMPQSGVMVRLDRSGRVTVFSGTSDIGQGSDSMLATVAAEELGARLGDVRVVTGDTDLTPVDLGAYSSRITLMAGLAAQEAMRSLRHTVQRAVAQHWNRDDKARVVTQGQCAASDVLLSDGAVNFRRDTSLGMDLAAAFVLAESAHGTLSASGGYRTTERGGDYRGGTIGASPAYSTTAHVAEVEVDEETGLFRIVKIWVAHDCGRALNPMLVEGQMEGSTSMGAAETNLEHMLYGDTAARAGMLVGPSLLDYRIPTSLDGPDLEAFIVEKPDDNGPYGAKEAGEGPLHSSIPAVANAIFDAVGIRLTELPFTPARVLAALKAQRRG
jgi:4-hydroxybenzoyl-CoA reductase subunit alpha